MTTMRLTLALVLGLLAATAAQASGTLGVYAVVENVVFEPNREDAAHIRVYGAFAFYQQADGGTATTKPVRGYLYFRRPPRSHDLALREWADIADMAGTGRGIAFGAYGYFGSFEDLAIDMQSLGAEPVARFLQNGWADDALGVRPVESSPTRPAIYLPSDTGVVLLGPNHEALVAELRAMLED